MPPPPRAYLLCGPSLAGKSTLARRLADTLGAVVVSADAINEERGLPFGGEGLPEAVWGETLERQLTLLDEHLRQGRSVILDDTLCYRWLRDRLRAAVTAAGGESVLLLLAPAREELLARHARLLGNAERPVLSKARLLEHLAAFEWPAAEEAPLEIGSEAHFRAWLDAEAIDRGSRP
jgi:predicted kinase